MEIVEYFAADAPVRQSTWRKAQGVGGESDLSDLSDLSDKGRWTPDSRSLVPLSDLSDPSDPSDCPARSIGPAPCARCRRRAHPASGLCLWCP